ncbi:hypothetical protein [Litchfieldella rifensis]|uniref:Uncharacterized protein n=1 Tax=Litchfieldella rifensis TaxID=762643 RepID=A0ABV7LKD2_9GAMM
MRALRELLVAILRRADTRYAALLVALGYTGLYLWLSGDIAGGGGGGLHASFPAWNHALETRAAFQFEPVGLITLGAIVWTFSPINTLLAVVIGALAGLNVGAGWLVWRAPRACRSPVANTGLLAALPALLVGGACCAPLVLIWLGLPIAGAVVSITPVLVPASLLLLLVGLWALARSLENP